MIKTPGYQKSIRRIYICDNECFLLGRYDRGRKGSGTGLSGLKLLSVTLSLLKEKSQLLILPIVLFIGMEQAFLFADFNAVSWNGAGKSYFFFGTSLRRIIFSYWRYFGAWSDWRKITSFSNIDFVAFSQRIFEIDLFLRSWVFILRVFKLLVFKLGKLENFGLE